MSKLPLVNESVLSSIPAAKRHIHDIAKELHFPFILYSILVGFYYSFRLNYTWLYFNDKSALTKSIGTKIFMYLIVICVAVLVMIPIFTKLLRIIKAMTVIIQYSKKAEQPFKDFIKALLIGIAIQVLFPVIGIYFSFVPDQGKLIALAALIALISSTLLLFAFMRLNKGLEILRGQGLYGSDKIKETIVGQYIIIGSLILYILIDAIFVTLGIKGYSILSAIFLVAYVTGYIVFVVGIDKFSNYVEFIKEKFD